MLTKQMISQLSDRCTNVADVWDCSVAVEQDQDGRLTFTMTDDGGDVTEGGVWTATPFELGHDLYSFQEVGGSTTGVVMTLVPVAIVGLLGL